MTTTALWLVLAGFLLGFTASTLWEWFYFRKQRVKPREARARAPEDKAHGLHDLQELHDLEERGALPARAKRQPAAATSYRSPGVFLESEGAPETPPAAPQPALVVAQDAAPLSPAPVSPRAPEQRLAGQAVQPPERSTGGSPPTGMRRRADIGLLSVRREALRSGASAQASPAQPALPASRPAWIDDPALTARAQDYPDNLSKVKGIGEVYRQRLYQAGIFTWHQVATTDIVRLRQATNAYPSSNVEEWPVQARLLAERQGRVGAVYTGPRPDDLTKIVGIGPVGAQTLYRAGICTYEQLAVTPAEELAALFPIAVAGDQPDFPRWIAQAMTLADAKHTR
jgi:predicted flap endonuclease-1-like 5' DNA nuclease